MGKFRASYLLTIEGLELLKKDKQVLLFPIFSMVASIALLAIFCISYWLLGGNFHSINYGILLLFYLMSAFTVTFFQAGLTVAVDARINGRSMTFKEGMKAASAHAEKIFLWSLVSATVGVVLGLISNLSKWLGKLVAFFLSASWGIITFFIVPALVLEEGNVSGAIKSSADTFKKTWGETLIMNFSAGLFLFIIGFSGILFLALLAFLLAMFLPAAFILPISLIFLTLIIIFFLGICILFSAINSIFRVVLYEYAKTGRIADTFTPELILASLKKKE